MKTPYFKGNFQFILKKFSDNRADSWIQTNDVLTIPDYKSGAVDHYAISAKFCDSEGVRTLDPGFRKPMLYPTELQNHIFKKYIYWIGFEPT